MEESHHNQAVVTLRIGTVKGDGEQQADFLWGEELTFLHGELTPVIQQINRDVHQGKADEQTV